jgi:predicted GNAT superfamily acetyltransferase
MFKKLAVKVRDARVRDFDVEPPNPVSAKFHARFGFREVGRQSVSYADKRVSMQEAPLAPAG